MPEKITPFRIEIPDDDLADLRQRLHGTRWPEPPTVPDWSQGVPLAYLQELCHYWAENYQWRAREARLNRFPQFRTTIDGLGIHFIHVISPEPGAFPVVLTHGWPGSVAEFTDVIGPLTDPAAHGGVASDAFHLVIPSLPGFGFSGKPTAPGWNRERIADAWAVLMARLGYDRYGAQGGDWGASISGQLGARHPGHVAGVHVNLISGRPDPAQTKFSAAEQRAMTEMRTWAEHHQRWEAGYYILHATRPQTIAYALTDSPAGQCAWILEKFFSWTDCGGDPVGAFGADRILDNITLYWLTATAASSARLYWQAPPAPFDTTVDVPAGASIFPKELGRPFRPWAERTFTDLRYWHEVDRGGHFAAFEQPDLFIQEIRNFFRLVR